MLFAPKHFIKKWFQIERTLRVCRLNHECDLDVKVLQTNKPNAVYTEVNEAFAGFKNQLHSLSLLRCHSFKQPQVFTNVTAKPIGQIISVIDSFPLFSENCIENVPFTS